MSEDTDLVPVPKWIHRLSGFLSDADDKFYLKAISIIGDNKYDYAESFDYPPGPKAMDEFIKNARIAYDRAIKEYAGKL